MNLNRDKIQQFVDLLAEKLGRSVAVDDQDRNFITCSRHFGDLDGLRVNVLVARQLDDRSSAYLYSFVDAENHSSPVRIPANDDLGITVRRCYPVGTNDDWVGFLWLIGEATEADDGIVAKALPELATVMAPQRGTTAGQEAVVWDKFLEALSGPRRHHEIRKFWTQELIDPRANMAVIVAYAHDHHPGGPQVKFLDALIAKSMHKRRIITTTPLTRGRLALTIIRDQHSLSPDNARFSIDHHPFADQDPERLSVGVSDWGPITESVELLKQATLAAYAAYDRKEDLTFWSDCTYQGVLLRAALEDKDHVIPKSIRDLPLKASGATLLKTLLVFLDECGDVARASLRLNIHRTTLYYRISRVEEQTGYDLKKGNDRLALQIGVGLLAFLGSEIPLFLHSEEK